MTTIDTVEDLTSLTIDSLLHDSEGKTVLVVPSPLRGKGHDLLWAVSNKRVAFAYAEKHLPLTLLYRGQSTSDSPSAPQGSEVQFVYPEDEVMEVRVNGETVAVADHETYGWGAMNSFRDAIRATVETLGGTVTEVGEPGF